MAAWMAQMQALLFAAQRQNPQFEVEVAPNPLGGVELAHVNAELRRLVGGDKRHVDAAKAAYRNEHQRAIPLTDGQVEVMAMDQCCSDNVLRCVEAAADAPVTLKFGCCTQRACPQVDFFVLLCRAIRDSIRDASEASD